MSLGIVFKGPEGMVLAADSRATLTAQIPGQNLIIPATFDNVTKLLRFNGQSFVGAVTYGLGSLGQQEPRTAHSFIPEFEGELTQDGVGRLSVEDFASKLSDFFMRQWKNLNMPAVWDNDPMIFITAGFDENQPYGRVFEFRIPNTPTPIEQNAGSGTFGITGGGQDVLLQRLLAGFDSQLIELVKQKFSLDDNATNQLVQELRNNLQARIPFQFLPLQDCVDLSITLIRVTMEIQSFMVDIRGVGGHIDVATITKTEGFKPVQQKTIRGERRDR